VRFVYWPDIDDGTHVVAGPSRYSLCGLGAQRAVRTGRNGPMCPVCLAAIEDILANHDQI
jgi:hypothetical protein